MHNKKLGWIEFQKRIVCIKVAHINFSRIDLKQNSPRQYSLNTNIPMALSKENQAFIGNRGCI